MFIWFLKNRVESETEKEHEEHESLEADTNNISPTHPIH
jgi:hypothetical protein